MKGMFDFAARSPSAARLFQLRSRSTGMAAGVV
jgi:hypothetical protein